MTVARWIARVAALGLFLAGTIVAAVRFGVVMAFSAAGGTLLYVVALTEQIWPPKTAPVVQKYAADTARVTEGVVIPISTAIAAVSTMSANVVRSIAPGVGGSSAILGGGGLSAHGAGNGGGSAILGFNSDVMHRLARGDHPTVRRL
jgi:hypothetical protein